MIVEHLTGANEGDMHQRQLLRKELEAFAIDFLATPVRLSKQDAELRQAKFGRLSRRFRQIIRLHHFESMKFEEIGNQLAIPTEEAETLWYEALLELKDAAHGP